MIVFKNELLKSHFKKVDRDRFKLLKSPKKQKTKPRRAELDLIFLDTIVFNIVHKVFDDSTLHNQTKSQM